MEGDHYTEHYAGDEDLQTTDEDHHSWGEHLHTTDDEEEDHHTGDEDLHTTYDDEGVNMEASEYNFSAPMALIRNQLKAPGMKVTEWSAKTGEALSVTRARMQEKFSRAGATVNYQIYSITHPLHPERREVAKDAAKQKKLFAADRRTAQEAEARSNAAAKIAAARQGRIETLEEGLHS